MAQAIVLLLLVVMVSYLLMWLWIARLRAVNDVRVISDQRTVRQVVIALASALLLVWTVFPFLWILLMC